LAKVEKVAVLIKDLEQQYEGLRTSLGLLLEAAWVYMYVLDHEIDSQDEIYMENLEFIDEMEGERFSNNQVNIEKYGFQPVNIEEMLVKLKEVDIIIPFGG
jgi:hypothetical protein